MRLLPYLLLGIIVSCNNASTDKTTNTAGDTVQQKNSIIASPGMPGPTLRDSVSNLANTLGWELVSDSIAQWPKDVFDYFIAERRKTDINYPYIAKVDMKGNGKGSIAALVKEKSNGQYQLLVIDDIKDPATKVQTWKEDIDICAISTYKKTGNEKVKMKGDGINVEYFEKAAFVIYWNGTELKRFYTAD
jgi:hypothetical protein